MFEALFRIVVQVETDGQGQRAFPVTKRLPAVSEAEFFSLLAAVYQEEVYPTLRANDTLTVTAHLDVPTREVERAFRFRPDRLFEGEGVQQPLADLLPHVQAAYEHFIQQVVPGDVLTIAFHIEQS